MVDSIIAMAKTFANLIYPLHCAVCKKPLDPLDNKGVCAHCAGCVRANPEPYCGICGHSVENSSGLCGECKKRHFHFTMARSACLYEGTIREAIHVFKYANGLRLASFLSGLMADFLKKNNALIQNIDAVTFVPLDGNRLRHRGFNQAKVLASRIAQIVKLPVIDSLDKTMRTSHQSELSRSGRLVNLRDTFRIRNAEDTAGKKILLVDDVMTTGSTLNECSKVLIENGAAEVRCLTLARGI